MSERLYKKRLYKKYEVSKTNGDPIDPNAQYFVLRIDTDQAARDAVLTYAIQIENDSPEFANQLRDWVALYVTLARRPSR